MVYDDILLAGNSIGTQVSFSQETKSHKLMDPVNDVARISQKFHFGT